MDNKTIICDYISIVKETNRLPQDDLSPLLQGLFGETGSLMTATKKLKREPYSSANIARDMAEEMGDILWYLCCLSSNLNIDFQKILLDSANECSIKIDFQGYSEKLQLSDINDEFNSALSQLGRLAGKFLDENFLRQDPNRNISLFLVAYFRIISLLKLNFCTVIQNNDKKISGKYKLPDNSELPRFDKKFHEFERIPDKFEIEFVERTENKQAIRWNGVFIGDPLSDASKDKDGYRFHDVFHFSYAVILHWSPTFRALIRHKRKSKPETDETEDGGRAIVIEEGLSAWIFNIAKENDFFDGRQDLTFDMLKVIEKMVKGFEVERCPLALWEKAILEGYKVFRELKKNNGGIVTCNKQERTLKYRRN